MEVGSVFFLRHTDALRGRVVLDNPPYGHGLVLEKYMGVKFHLLDH